MEETSATSVHSYHTWKRFLRRQLRVFVFQVYFTVSASLSTDLISITKNRNLFGSNRLLQAPELNTINRAAGEFDLTTRFAFLERRVWRADKSLSF